MENRSQKTQPLVSVVMCSYNTDAFIRKAVDSIKNQTYENWELIISDDGSTDGTCQFLRTLNDSRIRIFFQERNLGYLANKNFAISQAKGELITQQDSDDLCSPERLQLQVDVFQKNPGVRIVACGYNMIDEEDNELFTVAPEQEGLIFTKGAADYPFWFPALLVHKEVYERVGLFESYFAGVYGDDVYWTVKANATYPIYCLKNSLYQYRTNPNSITNVLDNKRKLVIGFVLQELFRQRQESGTDWLENGNVAALRNYEQSLLQNHKILGRQYQIWAAKAVDKSRWKQAGLLIKTSFNLDKTNIALFRTLVYYLKKRVKEKLKGS